MTTNVRINTNYGKITDPDMVNLLISMNKNAFKHAQNLLLSCDKYINKKGFFSSEKSRMEEVIRAYKAVKMSLLYEGFDYTQIQYLFEDKLKYLKDNNIEISHEIEFIFYMCAVSDALPNWQKEYDFISDFVGRV